MLIRFAICCGLAFSLTAMAEQLPWSLEKLPPTFQQLKQRAMERAIRSELDRYRANTQASKASGLPWTLAIGNARMPMAAARDECSIPLAQYKVSPDKQFFIGTLPVPKRAEPHDSMPVARMPVCGENRIDSR